MEIEGTTSGRQIICFQHLTGVLQGGCKHSHTNCFPDSTTKANKREIPGAANGVDSEGGGLPWTSFVRKKIKCEAQESPAEENEPHPVNTGWASQAPEETRARHGSRGQDRSSLGLEAA